jgi:hypothetical protein
MGHSLPLGACRWLHPAAAFVQGPPEQLEMKLPVVLHALMCTECDRQVSFTFESSLNFSHFSFPHYPASALPELPAFLRRAGHERLAALQASLRVHTPLFLWPPHGIAHRMMLRELCQRAPAILISPERLAQCATLLPAAEQFPALRAIRHPDPPPLVPRSISRGRGPESRQGQPTAHKY